MKEIEAENQNEGAYAIVKSLDRKGNVSEKLHNMSPENRKQYKNIMDGIDSQCRERTENYFLRASNYYKKNTNKVLEQTEDYAKSIDR